MLPYLKRIHPQTRPGDCWRWKLPSKRRRPFTRVFALIFRNNQSYPRRLILVKHAIKDRDEISPRHKQNVLRIYKTKPRPRNKPHTKHATYTEKISTLELHLKLRKTNRNKKESRWPNHGFLPIWSLSHSSRSPRYFWANFLSAFFLYFHLLMHSSMHYTFLQIEFTFS